MSDHPDVSSVPSVGSGTPLRGGVQPSKRLARWRGSVAIVGAILAAVVLVSIAGPLVLRDGYADIVGAPGRGPSANHWLGTDEIGRDVFVRLVYGGRVALIVGSLATAVAVLIGVPWGLLSGYLGGFVDTVSMRLTDGLLAFPSVILAMSTVAVLGPKLRNLILAIGIVQIPRFSRLVRAEVLSLRNREFVQAARVVGGRTSHILWSAILPNVIGVVLVQVGLTFATAILTEAALSFLGLGVQPPEPSWGGMLNSARTMLDRNVVYSISAGGAIFVTVLCLTLLGDAFTKALDPRQKRGKNV